MQASSALGSVTAIGRCQFNTWVQEAPLPSLSDSSVALLMADITLITARVSP
jgi:hypothetical protein